MGCPACLLMCCLLIIGHIQESLQLKIKQVTIPDTVREGKKDFVILDCDYDLEGTSSTLLVVKWWYFKDDKSSPDDGYVAYQWIYGRQPTAEPSFQKYIDVQYKASEDPYTMYRAMKLINPSVDLTGTYKCDISTVADEIEAKGSMVVFSTEKKFKLITRRAVVREKEGLEVTCLAEGLYPQPSLDISVEGVETKYSAKPIVTMAPGSQYYDILTRVDLQDEDLPELAILKCTLSIPMANYNVSRELIYQPVNNASMRSLALILIILQFFTVLI
ncbi:uncharacterized protein LOC127278779 isoform X2 [Leptopilina boulardi]|uniref:uncharacterized protein LOC127278779 isoform X2 n=1 Tax=Leptopilina boulardi TaxID=63433 RepID=UPI0021F6680B|nr:uncharacterized protein LOC127278779 isoform X2 [Leptopilina boulardi]